MSIFGQKKKNTQKLSTFKHSNKTNVSNPLFEKLKLSYIGVLLKKKIIRELPHIRAFASRPHALIVWTKLPHRGVDIYTKCFTVSNVKTPSDVHTCSVGAVSRGTEIRICQHPIPPHSPDTAHAQNTGRRSLSRTRSHHAFGVNRNKDSTSSLSHAVVI